jgi:Cu(I)/Ag(I) efflux system membrane fusion protein
MKYYRNFIIKNQEDFKHSVSRGFITYTCTNHPEIILNEPGKCPECGKDLVKKY